MSQTATILNMRTALYRHYDADGRLLYVGISLSPMARMSQHFESSAWFGGVVKIEIEWHENRKDALTAEKLAIKSGAPKFNIIHNCETFRRFVPVLRSVTLAKWVEIQGRGASSAFAREIGVSVSTMHALLHGRNIPSLPVALRIEDATGGAVPARAWVE